MCNSNGHFFQRISTQPKAVLRVLGVFGVAKELRAPTSPPPTPPGVGGWGTTAGASPRPLPGAAGGSGCLHGRRANVVRRGATERPGRALYNRAAADLRTGAGNPRPGQAPRVANLEDVYYQERTAIQFKETGIPGCKQREVESASATRDS